MPNKELETKLEEAQQLIENVLTSFDAEKFTEAGEALDKAYGLIEEVEAASEGEDSTELSGIISYLNEDYAGTAEQWEEEQSHADEDDEDAQKSMTTMRASIQSALDGLKGFEFESE